MSAMTTTYAVEVTRYGRWWMVSVPEVDGLTQARRLSDVDLAARELIAVTLDVPLSTVAVRRVRTGLAGGEDLDVELELLAKEKREAAAMAASAAERTRAIARRLHDAQVPVRDIGAALDISYQRAHQLLEQRP